ncbi:MAG TPA: response regulator [Candidatus Saccharimonadales bacterium]|nr:response regulator [Candidatus Saccharimonadales bacterium]
MDSHKRKIAIIEDDAMIVQMYKTKFELEGYVVQTAGDGQAGLELIEQFNPDVVLLDLMMPSKSGVELLEELRQLPGGQAVKVIVLTNSEDNTTTSRVYRTGPVDYIVKSELTPQQVVERVARLMHPPSLS